MLTMKDVFARRAGRLAFGVVLLLGAAYLVRVAWSEWASGGGPRIQAARILTMTWLAAAVAGVAVRAIAARLPGSRSAEALFTRSWVIPTVGVAVLLPITLHMPFALLANGEHGFDVWVVLSLLFTGVAHVVFAVLSAVRAYKLAIDKRAPSPRKIYVITLIVSCVPFALLLALPPMLVAVTGLPFLPLLRRMEPWIARERAELATIPTLPRATAMIPPANNL
jgi:hypothetical protein